MNEELVRVLQEQFRRKARRELRTWCIEAQSDEEFEPAAHHDVLIEHLERVAKGQTRRLLVTMPPGSAKTRYASILFTAWFMAQNPKRRNGRYRQRAVIGASHGSDYAEDLSMQILRYVGEHSRTLGYQNTSDNRKLWRTTNNCVYRAAGAGGSITGRRADLFVIDDPIKGIEEAESEVYREKVWKWYQNDVVSRVKQGGRIVLIQTRWHEDDLAGRIIEEMKAGGTQWTIVDMPAIWEARQNVLDTEPDVDVLDRKIGEALWPEEYSEETLAEKRKEVGERAWASLYQGRPKPQDGALFKKIGLQCYDAAPICNARIRSWDFGATAKVGSRDPDYTVGLLMGRAENGRLVVLDIVRFRGDPADVEAAVFNTADQDGRSVRIRIPQDPGAGGKTVAFNFAQKLMNRGFLVTVEREEKNKTIRATPMAAQVNIGNVGYVRNPVWNKPFLDELESFPGGAHDDIVDALSGAHSTLITESPIVMKISKEALLLSQQKVSRR